MTPIAASAPGKVLLCGEYAVLDGAPAISMAVDRRAHVRIRRDAADSHTLTTVGYEDGCFRFKAAGDGGVEWIDAPPSQGAFDLFESLWRRAGASAGASSLSISLDTRAFFAGPGGPKLGIGSSAAIAVAGAAALATASGSDAPVHDLAVDAHRAFQGGRGSGVDIATAYHGGVIEFVRGRGAAALAWPDGLQYRLLWSGRPARTTDRLARLGGRGASASGAALDIESRSVASAWRAGHTGRLLDAYGAYVEALSAYDLDHELGIFEAGHRELTHLAAAHAGLVYKPCGAGGGDVGVAFAETERRLAAFASDAAERGFAPLDATLEPDGLLVKG